MPHTYPMRNLLISLIASGIIVAPVRAADWRDHGTEMRRGAFVGVQVKLPFAGKSHRDPTASLSIAPTQTRISADGFVRTSVGEGVALNLTPSSKSSLTVAGVRADVALGLRKQGRDDRKLGVSSGGWVAIGVGVVALAAGAYVLHLYKEAEKNSD